MIGLPDVVGRFSFASVEKIVSRAIRFTAIMSQCDQGRVKLLDDPVHLFVIGYGPPISVRNVTHLTVDKRHRGWWFAQSEPFNGLFEVGG